jgi:HSP20 family molecular chaperone IbpA
MTATNREAQEGANESVQIVDLADAMLEAYSEITRRAHKKYVERDREPGRALDDWLAAERELSPPIHVDISQSEYFIHALVKLPGLSAERIFVGIEDRVAMFLVRLEHLDANADLSGETWNFASRYDVEYFTFFELPADANPARSVAVFADGVLTIRMSKK